MNIQPHYLTLSELLGNRLFRIPHYQRAYSWGYKQRKDMFDDIRKLRGRPSESFHFMATVVGLCRETTTIVTDEYDVIEIVDGQQRLTTLVLLLKSIEQELASSLTDHDRSARTPKARVEQDLQELLVKQDELSLILLQTNHDRSQHFANFLRHGTSPSISDIQTLADMEMFQAIGECQYFVKRWGDPIDLLGIIKNRLRFIFHEIDDESAVYTVFEVLNNRGLQVSWLDRLKSMLMSVAFENNQGNRNEHIEELHRIWGKIYETIGLRQGLSTEALRFGATLRSSSEVSKPFGEEKSVEILREEVGTSTPKAIEVSTWLLDVTKAVNKFRAYTEPTRKAVTEISQARLLALAIILRNFPCEEESKVLDQWEKTTFRIFGLCRKDARTGVGDYVRLAWRTLNCGYSANYISQRIRRIGNPYNIDEAFAQNPNCYERWQEELRYLLFRYEEHLAEQQGQNFTNKQWNRIWAASASDSIEHVFPQSTGSQNPEDADFVHRLGNLLLLPPRLNSKLGDKESIKKVNCYQGTGLLIAAQVARTIQEDGWAEAQIEEREQKILGWILKEWV